MTCQRNLRLESNCLSETRQAKPTSKALRSPYTKAPQGSVTSGSSQASSHHQMNQMRNRRVYAFTVQDLQFRGWQSFFWVGVRAFCDLRRLSRKLGVLHGIRFGAIVYLQVVLSPNPDTRSGNPKPKPGSNAANHRAELMSCSVFVQSESCLPVERPAVEVVVVVVVVVVLSTGHDYELSGTLGQTLGP